METQILVGLIGLLGVIISVFSTARSTQDKVTHQLQTQNEVQNQKIEHLSHEIENVKAELTEALANDRKVSDIKLQQMQDKQVEMAVDLKEHNNYAKQLPEIQSKLDVITEKVEVSNKRITDLETFQHDMTNRMLNK